MNRKSIEEKINELLNNVRPYLAEDGGDIEFVKYEEDTKVAEVRFLGACADCSLAIMTLRAGVERIILKNIPEIKRIEMVR